MRNMKTMLAAMAAVGLLAGCASDVGERGAGLHRVDQAAMMSQVLYVAPDVSDVPLTAVELEEQGLDPVEAVPVRVEIFENIAVAWFAPDGQALIGREFIVSLWRVVEREPIAGEVAPGEEYDVTEPPSADGVAYLRPDEGAYASAADVDPEQVEPTPYDFAAEAIIEFFDRAGTPEELAIIEELGGYHPGCL